MKFYLDFEIFWLLQVDFPGKLKEWWEEIPTIKGTQMYQVQQKLKILKTKIKKWNKKYFGNIFKEKAELEGKIKEVQMKGIQNAFTMDIREQERTLIQEFSQREHQEEISWNHKSRVKWLQEGEINTSLFHKQPFITAREAA